MPIKAGEVGKTLDVGTFFDVSGATDKEIHVKNPVTGVVTTFPDGRITTPVTASPKGYEAGTYYRMLTIATDFPDAGEWPICVEYVDATPKDFDGDKSTLTIGEACDL